MTTTTLHLGDVDLPEEAVTQTFGILGKRGAGKSTTARAFAEELLRASLPVVILDPTGAWWGIRSSTDGRKPGFPVVIFGGDHADVPLEETAGALVADVIIDERISALLDFSHMTKGEMRRFVTAFLERLFHRNRQALQVVVDEADLFAPQRLPKGAERLLGAMEDLCRRGRIRGLGVTLITQRPQSLHKDVLSQIEALIIHRLIGPREVAAIDEWVRLHADEADARQVKADMPSLPVGVAWLWSPGWLGILRKITVQRPTTFDSSATPKPGEKRAPVRTMAPVDLAKLGERIAATVERARAEDPRVLRQEISKLRRELAKKSPEPVEVVRTVELVPTAFLDAVHRAASQIHKASEETVDALMRIVAEAEKGKPSRADLEPKPRRVKPKPVPEGYSFTFDPSGASEQAIRETVPANGIPASRQRILDSLAELESIGIPQADKTQLALWARTRPTSGGYKNNLGALRSAGLIGYPQPGTVALTAQGREEVEAAFETPTVEALHDRVRSLVSDAKWRILAALIHQYPDALGREELANMVGVPSTSGGFKNNLGSLRSLGLLDYPSPGTVAATGVLFMEAR